MAKRYILKDEKSKKLFKQFLEAQGYASYLKGNSESSKSNTDDKDDDKEENCEEKKSCSKPKMKKESKCAVKKESKCGLKKEGSHPKKKMMKESISGGQLVGGLAEVLSQHKVDKALISDIAELLEDVIPIKGISQTFLAKFRG